MGERNPAFIASQLSASGRRALAKPVTYPTSPWANTLLINAGLLNWRRRWFLFGPHRLTRTRLGDAVLAVLDASHPTEGS